MEWEVRHTEYDLCHPQIPCSTYHNVNAVLYSCTVWLHQRRATGRSSMIQQRPLPRQTPLSWRVRFMEHAIKDKDDELYPGESKAHRERHTGESALQTAALVSQGQFCSGFVWPQDQSLLLTLPSTVTGPLRANLI